jgi:hypothetical protein
VIATIPWRVSFCLWSAFQMGIFAFLARRVLGGFAILAVLSLPAIYSATLGQTGLLLTDAIVGAFLLLPNRPVLAATLLAVAGCIKPQSMLAAPFVLWRNRLVFLAVTVVTAVLCVLSLVFGPARWLEWVHFIPVFRQVLILTPLWPGAIFPFVGWKIALAVTGIAFAAWDRSFRGFVVGTLLVSPYFQLYDIAAVSILSASYVQRWWRSRDRSDAPLAAIGLFVVICPMPAVTLLAFGLAVIVDGLRSRYSTEVDETAWSLISALDSGGVSITAPPRVWRKAVAQTAKATPPPQS